MKCAPYRANREATAYFREAILGWTRFVAVDICCNRQRGKKHHVLASRAKREATELTTPLDYEKVLS